jgi:hypothetical protein
MPSATTKPTLSMPPPATSIPSDIPLHLRPMLCTFVDEKVSDPGTTTSRQLTNRLAAATIEQLGILLAHRAARTSDSASKRALSVEESHGGFLGRARGAAHQIIRLPGLSEQQYGTTAD